MAKALAESDTSDVLAKIDVPTLLPWSEGDRRWPLGVAERFRSLRSPAPERHAIDDDGLRDRRR